MVSLQAKVVNRFVAKEHGDRIYERGDYYPAEGCTADAERVVFLSKVHPHYKKIFLSDIREIDKPNKKAKGKTVKNEEKPNDKE